MAEPRLLHACQRGRRRPVSVGGCAGAPAGGRRSRWRRPSLRLGCCGGGKLSTRCGGGHRGRGRFRRPQTSRRAGCSTFVAEIKRQTSIRRWGGLGYGRTQRLAMAPGGCLGACTRRAAGRGHARPNLGHSCPPEAPRACPGAAWEGGRRWGAA